jgi:hypothetical protein
MSWIGDKSGGDMTHPTFRNNPQFDIFLKNPDFISVSLTQDRDVELLDIGFYMAKGDGELMSCPPSPSLSHSQLSHLLLPVLVHLQGSGYPLPFILHTDIIAQCLPVPSKTGKKKKTKNKSSSLFLSSLLSLSFPSQWNFGLISHHTRRQHTL